MRKISRRDDNEPTIIRAAKMHAEARDTPIKIEKRESPDLLIGYRGQNILVEVKNPNSTSGDKGSGDLSDDQRRKFAEWPGQVSVVWTPDDMTALLVRVDKVVETLMEKTPGATQEDLRAMGQVDAVGADTRPRIIRARCHPEAGIQVSFEAVGGDLTLRCQECAAGVLKVAVAEPPIPSTGD